VSNTIRAQGTLFRPGPVIPCAVARQQSRAPFHRTTENVTGGWPAGQAASCISARRHGPTHYPQHERTNERREGCIGLGSTAAGGSRPAKSVCGATWTRPCLPSANLTETTSRDEAVANRILPHRAASAARATAGSPTPSEEDVSRCSRPNRAKQGCSQLAALTVTNRPKVHPVQQSPNKAQSVSRSIGCADPGCAPPPG
jgi:hypothetical protein